MSVMVIGGTGFIGAKVVKLLVEQGEKVVVMDLFPNFERVCEVKDRITILKGTLTSIEGIIEAIRNNEVRKIINLAYHLESESDQLPHEAIKVNVQGTNNVFEAARIMGIERVVWASSIAVYGDKKRANGVPQDENAPCVPITVYGAGKQFTEFMIHFYNKKYAMDIVGLRPAAIYGTGRSTGATSWLSDFVDMPVKGEAALLPASPQQTLSWCYVDDTAAAFVAVCQYSGKCPSDIYNIGGYIATVKEAMDLVVKELPDTKVVYGDRYIYYLDVPDNKQITKEIGFELRFDLEKGIRDHILQASKRFK